MSGDANAEELTVMASFPPGTPAALGVESGAERFLRDVRVAAAGGDDWRAVALERDTFTAPECAARGCRVQYRFRLADAARAAQDVDTAFAVGGAIEAPASTWLLHPSDVAPRAYRLHFARTLPFLSPYPSARRSSGDTEAAGSDDDAYEVRRAALDVTPFAGIGAGWRARKVTVGGATLTIGIAPSPGPRGLDDDGIVAWIGHAAEGIASYYGRFPSASALFLVLPDKGTSTNGKTLGGGGESIIFQIGPALTPAAAREGWVATHEMIHMNFPSFGYLHSWLEEGIATYVEPIIRARAGIISPDSMWHDFMQQGPEGLPKPGDEGLERTHTWGRTYWGGALFCLLADVEIRTRTQNAHSFDDVMRAVVATGATVAVTWDIERLLDVGDAATGQHVLHELFARYAQAPTPIDLPLLWRRLGVALRGDKVVYDDTAPLAAVRRAITAASPGFRPSETEASEGSRARP